MSPKEYLLSLGRPHVTFPEIAKALDLEYITLHWRLKNLPPEEHPDAFGAFRAGGVNILVLDNGIRWVERHQKYWAERQAARRVSE